MGRLCADSLLVIGYEEELRRRFTKLEDYLFDGNKARKVEEEYRGAPKVEVYRRIENGELTVDDSKLI